MDDLEIATPYDVTPDGLIPRVLRESLNVTADLYAARERYDRWIQGDFPHDVPSGE